MSYNRAYTAGDLVRVDAYAPGLNPLPTLGDCTYPGTVTADTIAAEIKVYVAIEGYPTQAYYKDRVTP